MKPNTVLILVDEKTPDIKDENESSYKISDSKGEKELPSIAVSPVLATIGNKKVIEVLVDDDKLNVVTESEQYIAKSYTDLAAKVIMGEIPVDIYKSLMQIEYEEDGEMKRGTIADYEASTKSKKWSKVVIPHKWFGIDTE